MKRTDKISRRGLVLSLAGAATLLVAPKAAWASYHGQKAATGAVVVVEMNNRLRFTPDEIRIKVGDTVEWRNVQSYGHTITADPALVANPANVELPPGAKPFDSGRVAGGQSYRRTFDTPGVYRYVCLPHEGREMLGTVIVG